MKRWDQKVLETVAIWEMCDRLVVQGEMQVSSLGIGNGLLFAEIGDKTREGED